MGRRVVITGMGVISALGQSIPEFWNNCLAGKVVVERIPEYWKTYSSFKSNIWSVLPEIDFAAHDVRRVDLLKYDRVTALGLCATNQALLHSGLPLRRTNTKERAFDILGIDPYRAGVYMGTGSFGACSFLDSHAHQVLSQPKERLLNVIEKLQITPTDRSEIEAVLNTLHHPEKYHPLTVSRLMPNAVSAAVGIKYSIHGPTNTVALACAAGTAAIGHAFRAVRDGYIDLAVTGGCEYWNDSYGAIFRAFDIANALVRDCSEPERANRPFDRHRSGFLFSQGGAAALVIEDIDSARRRNAKILAEIIGYSESFDAYSMMGMSPDGVEIEQMLRSALNDADIEPSRIDYVNSHGTGTIANDELESRVIERVFGRKVKVNSTKSLLGHTIGASGAIEAVVTVLSLRNNTTHICKNLNEPCSDLNYVVDVESSEFEYGCTHSFAFGGHNAGLILKRYQ